MSGTVWKSKVNNLGSSMDRCREQIDRLVKMDNPENFKKEIYSNGNTRVEVNIKTRMPSGDRKKCDKDWSSLMSDDTNASDIYVTKVNRNRPRKSGGGSGGKTVVAKKSHLGVDGKHFAQGTKSSQAKKSIVATAKSSRRVRQDSDVVDAPDSRPSSAASGREIVSHRFQSRTLKIFIQEMKFALQNDLSGVEKILADLEFVADNLESPRRLKMASPIQRVLTEKRETTTQTNFSKEMSDDQKSQLYEMTLLRSEAKRIGAENKEMRKILSDADSRLATYESELHQRDEKLADLKLIISRLTSNNNDMLAILASKATMEDEAKKLQEENRRLCLELEVQKGKNNYLNSLLGRNQSEITRMHRVISDLKSSLNRNIEEENRRKFGPGVTESTVDLELSSDAKSIGGEDGDDDDDSAIGEGISESHPLSSAPQSRAAKKESKPRKVSASQNQGPIQVTQSSPFIRPPMPPVPAQVQDASFIPSNITFQAAVLDLSETRDSDGTSTAPESNSSKEEERFAEGDKERKQKDEEMKKAALAAAAQDVDAKVQSFLDRLRHDKKFQVSVSSDLMRQHDPLSTIGDITGLTTELETTHLTEAKFRQGLEDLGTLNLSDTGMNQF